MSEHKESPTTGAPTESLLTMKQVAQILSVTERTVASLVGNGTLPSIKLGSARRIHREALNEFVKNGTPNVRQRTLSRREIAEHITDCNVNPDGFGTAKEYLNLLWQIAAHHVRVIDNKPQTQADLERTIVFHAVALYVRTQLKVRLDMKRIDGVQLTANERLSVKHLDAAIEAFNAATKAAGFQTDLFTNGKLPELIWFNFYGITVERAQHIADSVYAGIEGAERWQAETLQRLQPQPQPAYTMGAFGCSSINISQFNSNNE